ncbi:GNAT family N-acetyltransferase [uncultured Clostridium sp.]|uniref:GNAT family N-acetyltransferase n=1 Tax=uncultured Clostridium sp. TaxID=59620 RepID=UPI002619F248|nr:GNAT family N-acetyltransferase [uncultured Clostridium sp.]
MIITTSRLILRPFLKSDLSNLHHIMSNEDVACLAGFATKKTLEETNIILNIFLKESPNSLWAIYYKNENKVLGWIELHSPSISIVDSKEIGFVLSKDYWGLGLMPEAILGLISYAFDTLNITTLICSHFENNIQSQKVIAKCGFKFIFKQDSKLYYLLSFYTL